MALPIAELLRALRQSNDIDEFIVGDKSSLRAGLRLGSQAASTIELAREQEVTVFVDQKEGRGGASVQLRGGDSIDEVLRAATLRAASAIGRSWRLQLPSAPARVRVADLGIRKDPESALRILKRELEESVPTGCHLLDATLVVEQAKRRAILSTGFDDEFDATTIELRGWLRAKHGRVVSLSRMCRHRDQLRLAELLGSAEKRSARVPSPLGAQVVDIALSAHAYQPSRASDDFGIWSPLVAQCDAERTRAGLARFRVGQAVTAEAPRGEALSAGSLAIYPYGLRSAPFADDGRALRSIQLVDQGIAKGMSLSHREAGLRKLASNGGVSNLDIGAGSRSRAELETPGERPLLLVEHIPKIQWTAEGSLLVSVSSGMLLRRRPDGRVSRSAVADLLLSGNLFEWLEDTHYSSETTDTSWARLPETVRVRGVQLLS